MMSMMSDKNQWGSTAPKIRPSLTGLNQSRIYSRRQETSKKHEARSKKKEGSACRAAPSQQLQSKVMMMKSSLLTFLWIIHSGSITALTSETYQSRHQCEEKERHANPHLCHLMDIAATDPDYLASELLEWSKSIGCVLDPPITSLNNEGRKDHDYPENMRTSIQRRGLRSDGIHDKNSDFKSNGKNEEKVPTVMAHGMGDSCFNGGMQSITKRVGSLTDSYSTCIPTADNLHDDVINGYLLNMDASVDIFAEKVRLDPNLQNGFNAIGFSQGNNVIRGYIARYNDPPVNKFLSVHGVNAGIGALPYCLHNHQERKGEASDETIVENTALGNGICDALMETASHRAYSTFAQKHSFQANYWRDPRPEQQGNYLKYSQLARWNNEVSNVNSTFNENWSKTNTFIWVMALDDKIVVPKEGEQWGAPDPLDPFGTVLERTETRWFKDDLFGLRTAEEEGKNFYESVEGDHLQFQMHDFDSWVKKYFV